jgi:hypothetical protein
MSDNVIFNMTDCTYITTIILLNMLKVNDYFSYILMIHLSSTHLQQAGFKISFKT